MIHVITKDNYFFLGIQAAIGDEEINLINSIECLADTELPRDVLVIDTFLTGSFTPDSLKKLCKLKFQRIVFFSILKVTCLPLLSTVYFVSRNTSPSKVIDLLMREVNRTFNELPSYSMRQLIVAQLCLGNMEQRQALDMLGISSKTYEADKYRLMLQMRIRKWYHIVKLPIFNHLSTLTILLSLSQ